MMNLRPLLKLEIVTRRTPLGMKQYLMLDGALWDVEGLCAQIRQQAAAALVDKEMRDLIDRLDREMRENASTDRDVSPKCVSSSEKL